MKKKLLALSMVLVASLVLAGCGKKVDVKTGDYTYNTYSTALGDNWNPHTWETNAESSVLGYITTPFVDISIDNSEDQTYQWVYEAATKVEDVTKSHRDDLTKYGSTLPASAEGNLKNVKDGFVFEITLRKGVEWENGTEITADDYIESFKLLLDPTMMNYRANNYIVGESAVAGGYAYYYALTKVLYKNADVAEAEKFGEEGCAYDDLFIDVWGFWGANGYVDAEGNKVSQYVSILDEVAYSADGAGDDEFTGADLWAYYGSYLLGDYSDYLFYAEANTSYNENYSFDSVGLYKVNDYKIRYVCATYEGFDYFLTSLTDNWVVYVPTYKEQMYEQEGLKYTKYNTSKETTMSFGPYRIESLEAGKQLVYVQNENWWGYQKDAEGKLYSVTQFKVDGEYRQQYQTTKIVVDVMTDETAKQKFMNGELDDWTPAADEVSQYVTSQQLYQVPETYTMRLFFNTDVDALKEMDKTKGNTNSVVLSNVNFRKAFSLAINRSEWVKATAGYIPAFSLINNLYYYNVFEDPESIYRSTTEAKQAVVNIYGVKYGKGEVFATLDEAYDSITGYNLTDAKALMKQACEELVAAGLYTAGQPITINFGWKKGALDSDDNRQVALFQQYLNAAAEGSGFGTITLVAVGNISNRYTAVPNGDYAVGYGAWGGAAFYPFTMFRVYMDPDYADLHEAACWNPKTYTFTLTVNGKQVTKTAQEWSNSMSGSGDYAEADFSVKLSILAQLEEQYIKLYYCIPLASSTECSMLSYKVKYYTEDYNIMYGFGGLRLMSYNYTDAEWTEYVKTAGGTLDYTK